jgi:hypothetical protein
MTSLFGGAQANRRAFTGQHWAVTGRLMIAEAGAIQSVGEINLDCDSPADRSVLLCFPSVEGTIHVYRTLPYHTKFDSQARRYRRINGHVNIRAIVCGYCPAQTQQYGLGKG